MSGDSGSNGRLGLCGHMVLGLALTDSLRKSAERKAVRLAARIRANVLI